jgi:hypothetical protein
MRSSPEDPNLRAYTRYNPAIHGDKNPNIIQPIPSKPRPFLKDAILNGKYVIEKREMRAEELAIARDFRRICYQFEYCLKLNQKSEILEVSGGVLESRVTFYPFMRMLFHKIGHDLDKLLWDDMLKETKGQINRLGNPVPRKSFPW